MRHTSLRRLVHVLDDFVALATRNWSRVVALKPNRFHQVLVLIKLLHVDIAPPGIAAWTGIAGRKIVEKVSPLAQLDGAEDTGIVRPRVSASGASAKPAAANR